MKKFKEARGKGCTVYFSKWQPDKLFVDGTCKCIPANAPLTDVVQVRVLYAFPEIKIYMQIQYSNRSFSFTFLSNSHLFAYNILVICCRR